MNVELVCGIVYVVDEQIANVPAGDIPKRKLLWKQVDHYCGGCHYSIRSGEIIGTTWAAWDGDWDSARPKIEVLARIPLETLRALAPNLSPYVMEERQALQAIALRPPGAADTIVPAAEAANPDRVSPDQRDWVLDIVTPELQLGFHALAHDPAKFDEWMVIAINGHHHYYGRGDEKNSAHSQLALAPLAMACVARDLGVTTTVESHYMPRWLITG